MQSIIEPPSGQEIKDLLIRLFAKVEQIESKVEQIESKVEQMESDISQVNAKFEKWDGRLWGLTLGLIGTAWAAIIAAAVVVTVRSLAGI